MDETVDYAFWVHGTFKQEIFKKEKSFLKEWKIYHSCTKSFNFKNDKIQCL